MKAKKLAAVLLSGAMVVSSLAACGEAATLPETEVQDNVGAEVTPDANDASVVVAEEGTSLDFEDGACGFVGNDTASVGGTKDATISVADFNGSKALKVEAAGKTNIGFQMDALLGDKAADVASIDLSIGLESADGTFRAASGALNVVCDGAVVESSAWSVYLETANPKTFTLAVADASVFAAGGNFTVSLTTDNQADETGTPSVFYIDNVTFRDADGKIIEADTSAEFVAVGGAVDNANICALTGAVELEGFQKAAGEWAQDGLTMSDEFLEALVPGSVIELSFSSESGNLWIVMPDAAAGWSRVGQNGSGDSAYINAGKSICQVTYEQIEAICGTDKSTWGARLQAESDTPWEVYSVKVGQATPGIALTGATEIEGFSVSEGEWTQAGIELTEEQQALLVPGSVVEFTYSSESGNLWLVMPWAEVGWSRVGQNGSGDDAVLAGGKCYVTYEQIAAICGDDVSTWGTMVQAESDTPWEVYSMRIGTKAEMPMVHNNVEIEGFQKAAGEWAQDGLTLTDEQLELLVPGSVLTFTYSCDSGNLWVVMPDAAAGWSRVGQNGSGDDAICANGVCQVTYEQIAAVCGDDKSTWGTRIQAESDTPWEVYSLSIGVTK